MNRFLVLTLVVSIVLSGCVSKPNSIGAFGKATEDITEQVDQVLVDLIDGEVEKDLIGVASRTGAGAQKLVSSDFDNIGPVFDEKAKQKLALYQANTALTKYAKGLQNLAGASSQNDIDLAVANLSQSMESANGSYVALTGEDDDLFAKEDVTLVYTAIAVIGSN
ncbi:hypothetical protein [Vibrio maerlii]|uniref:hypothetical protein n=1 Tax=Vibrio maerlii TaxID=2231648 RepID=UPI000E3E4A04|nr:hypothetical protein [Vibrio maerlii]